MKFMRYALPALVLTASLVVATTLSEVTQTATTLQAAYSDLNTRIAACPSGACPDRDAILATFSTLESDRAALHTARETLNPCGNCGSVDALISDVDDSAAAAGTTIEEWELSG